MPTLEDAIALAAKLHKGQKDKGGEVYILHPLRVMMLLDGEMERMTAVLHDVVEDCDITVEDLRKLGYPLEVIQAVNHLSKRPEEEGDYDAFISRIKNGSDMEILVKLADLTDNLDPTRSTGDDDKSRKRREKYRRARTLLRRELAIRDVPFI